MAASLDASNFKPSEGANRQSFTVMDIFEPGEQQNSFGASFAASQADRPVSDINQMASEMLSGFGIDGSEPRPGDNKLKEGAPALSIDGMEVGVMSESITKAATSGTDARNAFEAYVNGKPSDPTAPQEFRAQLQRIGLDGHQARLVIDRLDKMMRDGVNLGAMVNLPRREFETQMRALLTRYANRS